MLIGSSACSSGAGDDVSVSDPEADSTPVEPPAVSTVGESDLRPPSGGGGWAGSDAVELTEAPAPADALVDTSGASLLAAADPIPVPSNMAKYCSVRSASTGAWALFWGGTDPCATALANFPGTAIQAAGLYSTNSRNNTLVQCSNNFVGVWFGNGATAMQLAFDHAMNNGATACRFTVAPAEMPIFRAPFNTSAAAIAERQVALWQFMDHALTPVDVRVFGRTPVAAGDATLVDYKGFDRRNSGGVEGHGGYDWGMREGTPLIALGQGTVIGSEAAAIPGCSDPQQNVFVEHRVGSGRYEERFVSIYAHLSGRNVSVGDAVVAGSVLGWSGDTGCTGGLHLHFAVVHTTNIASGYRNTFTVGVDQVVRGIIDPFGWAAPQGMDPMGHRFLNVLDQGKPVGAWGIRLWKSTSVPPGP